MTINIEVRPSKREKRTTTTVPLSLVFFKEINVEVGDSVSNLHVLFNFFQCEFVLL